MPLVLHDSGMMIRYVIEAIARDGNAAALYLYFTRWFFVKGSLKMLK